MTNRTSAARQRHLRRHRRRMSLLVGLSGRQADTPGRWPTPAVITAGRETAAAPPEDRSGAGEVAGRKRRKRRRRRPAWTLENFQVPPREGEVRFHDFDLPLSLMRGICEQGFRYCTPIQARALPEVLAGRDLVGRASTGTGKSAVFLIGLMSRLVREQGPSLPPGTPRALVIAPTRELVQQIAKDGRGLGRFTQLRIVPVFGGTDYKKQEDELRKRRVDILVATPGRLLDFVSRRVVRLNRVRTMIIDEADRMLDMGFIPDVRRIIGRIPEREQRQTLLFSATITDDVRRLADQWCVDPVSVETEVEQVAVETVEQIVYMTTSEEKYHVLYNLITGREHERIIVFANMKNQARRLYERLRGNGIDCALLTGDVPQDKRMARLERFRDGRVRVLIATDVAGRGIHIEGISHVVNYTLPYEPEDYVHRIGRTGRAGNSGISISFADEEDGFVLPVIEEFIGRSLPCAQPDEDLLKPAPPVRERPRSKPRSGRGRKRRR